MHTIEPFYNWLDDYQSEHDERSPFFERTYSEFEFSSTVYNYYIHPQWDNFGSSTLYLKVLFADYKKKFVVIEFLGEWNDVIENDVSIFYDEVFALFREQGIVYFILIGENILNYHSDSNEYYEQMHEELQASKGWLVFTNLNTNAQYDYKKYKLQQFIPLLQLEEWRSFTPPHLLLKIKQEFAKQQIKDS